MSDKQPTPFDRKWDEIAQRHSTKVMSDELKQSKATPESVQYYYDKGFKEGAKKQRQSIAKKAKELSFKSEDLDSKVVYLDDLIRSLSEEGIE